MDLLEQPPDGFDIVVLERDVGIVEVYPVSHAPREVVPQVFVAEDAGAAGGVVLFDAVRLDLASILEPEFLLDLDLNGQSVRVPSRFPLHAEALHRLVTTEDVLDGARHHVMDARPAVGGGRSFVKREGGRVAAVREALLEDLRLVPPGEDLRLQPRMIEALDFLERHIEIGSKSAPGTRRGRYSARPGIGRTPRRFAGRMTRMAP